MEDGWEEKVTAPAQAICVFTKQLSILLRNGVDIIQAMDVLSHQEDNPNLGVVVATVAVQIEKGNALSESLAAFPRIFSPMYCAMVAAGESTGQLAVSLDRLGDWIGRDSDIRHRVWSALTYPLFVLVVAVFLTLAVFYFVMPEFVGIFAAMDVPLPLLTRVTFFATEMIRNPGFWLLLAAAAVVSYRWLQTKWSTSEGAAEVFLWLLKIPAVGKLLRYATLARFASAAELCLISGLEIGKTLDLAARASGSPTLRCDRERLKKALIEGEHLSEAMGQSQHYHSTLVFFTQTGEEVAQLEAMMAQAGKYYNRELEHSVATLGALLEPVLLFGVAIVVGVILLSIFLPMYGMIGQLT